MPIDNHHCHKCGKLWNARADIYCSNCRREEELKEEKEKEKQLQKERELQEERLQRECILQAEREKKWKMIKDFEAEYGYKFNHHNLHNEKKTDKQIPPFDEVITALTEEERFKYSEREDTRGPWESGGVYLRRYYDTDLIEYLLGVKIIAGERCYFIIDSKFIQVIKQYYEGEWL